LKNKNKSCPYKKLSVFYNSCLKTLGYHLIVFGEDTHMYTLGPIKRKLTKIQIFRLCEMIKNLAEGPKKVPKRTRM
jgi:hypothetical protein